MESQAQGVLDSLRTNLATPVYDCVDFSTKISNEKSRQIAQVDAEIAKVSADIEKWNRRLHRGSGLDTSTLYKEASLSDSQRAQATGLQACLQVLPKLSASQLTTDGKLVCGGVLLKNGDTAQTLQANWDLIDTVTGADA